MHVDQQHGNVHDNSPLRNERPNNTYCPQGEDADQFFSTYNDDCVIGKVAQILDHPKASTFGPGITAVIIECGDSLYRYTDAGPREAKEQAEADEAKRLKAAEEAAAYAYAKSRRADADAIVEKGAEWLDVFFRDTAWRDTIREAHEHDGFDLADGARCVLGLTATLAHINNRFWGFTDYIRDIGVTTYETHDTWMAEHGFNVETTEGPDKLSYNELQQAWERLLFS